MGLNFRLNKRIPIGDNMYLNVSKSGANLSLNLGNMVLCFDSSGKIRTRTHIAKGVSYTENLTKGGKQKRKKIK